MNVYQVVLIKNIKKYRSARKISQAEFAELCNVSTGTIGNIECGIAKPSFDLIITMANVLGVQPARLLEDVAADDDTVLGQADRLFLLELYENIKKYIKDD